MTFRHWLCSTDPWQLTCLRGATPPIRISGASCSQGPLPQLQVWESPRHPQWDAGQVVSAQEWCCGQHEQGTRRPSGGKSWQGDPESEGGWERGGGVSWGLGAGRP